MTNPSIVKTERAIEESVGRGPERQNKEKTRYNGADISLRFE